MARSTGSTRAAGAVNVVLAAVAATACSSSGSNTSSDPVPADKDITITSCAPSDDPSDGYLAKPSVTIHDAQANDYVVTVRRDTIGLGRSQVDRRRDLQDHLGVAIRRRLIHCPG